MNLDLAAADVKVMFTDAVCEGDPEEYSLGPMMLHHEWPKWWVSSGGNFCMYKPGTRTIWAFRRISITIPDAVLAQ